MFFACTLDFLITSESYLYFNLANEDFRSSKTPKFSNRIKVWKPNRFSKHYLIPESKYIHLWHMITGFYYEVWYVENQEHEIVHHSVVHAKYFKFPFMQEKDLQIGLVRTAVKYRNKGLATNMVNHIVSNYKSEGNKIWYITQNHNKESIKIAAKNGATIPLNGCKKYFDVPLLRKFSQYLQ